MTALNGVPNHGKVLSAVIRALSVFIRVTGLWVACGTALAVTVTDDLGRKVELKQPAERIVALAPFLTELAYSAGAGSRLVGASAYSDYPPGAKSLPQVASASGPEIEPLAALAPDLVLAWLGRVIFPWKRPRSSSEGKRKPIAPVPPVAQSAPIEA